MKNEIKTVKTFVLDNLDCANCAAKIERGVNNIDGITTASCDFLSKKLIIQIDQDRDIENILKQAKDVVNRIEPDTNIIELKDKLDDTKKHNHESHLSELMPLMIGAVLFIIGFIVNLSYWQEFFIFLLSYLFVGGEILLKALKNIIRGKIFDENFLMVLATIGAFSIGEFAEGVAVMLFYQVGELFQHLAVDKSRKSISELMDIRPDYANIKTSDGILKVDPKTVNVGDFIIVKPGEKVPLDGIIVEGNSFIDTTALTGESVLREVEAGSTVLSGFINKNGLLTVKVTKTFGESTVSVILDLVENASSKKAKTENFITKFARYYTPAVVVAALLIAFLPVILIEGALLSTWGYRALVFLVISCPCALVISIPLGFFGGIGGASKRGILVKGSNYLEALNNVDTVVFDKTGTLTKGVFVVTEIVPVEGYQKEQLIEYASYAESYSNHPIAKSIMAKYDQNIDQSLLSNYEEVFGQGIKVRFKNQDVLVGNTKLMDSNQIKYTRNDIDGTVIYVAVDQTFIGHIVISDQIKSDAKKTINDLKSLGINNIVMLTGDHKNVGDRVGRALGINQVYSELLPNDKVRLFEEIEQCNKEGHVLFVGDGINDAPVLKRADVGIAMGGLGSDAAIEAADIVIMTDEPSKIAIAIKIARRTRRIVWQNIIFAIGIKLLFLTLGAFGLASMWEAVFADVGVSIIAILNAMRVLNTKYVN